MRERNPHLRHDASNASVPRAQVRNDAIARRAKTGPDDVASGPAAGLRKRAGEVIGRFEGPFEMELKEELPWETDSRSAEPAGSPLTKTMARTGKTRRPRQPGSFSENVWPQRPALLRFDELPAWRRAQANKYVHRGYRPHRAEGETGSYYPDALRSWFYLHNESFNIHSHLWPAVTACPYALVSMIYDQQERGAPAVDTFMCTIFFIGAFGCLFLSAMFHTMYECCYECSQTVGSFWSKMDYVGIILMILGSFFATTHFQFYCEPSLKVRPPHPAAQASSTSRAQLLSCSYWTF